MEDKTFFVNKTRIDPVIHQGLKAVRTNEHKTEASAIRWLLVKGLQATGYWPAEMIKLDSAPTLLVDSPVEYATKGE